MPVHIARSEDMTVDRVYVECLFGTALIASVLVGSPQAAAVSARACDFIAGQKLRGWLWNYHFRTHTRLCPPPDVDDTALALHALAGNGRKVPRNLARFLANRNGAGQFYTWFFPLRSGRLSLRLIPGCWRQLLLPWRHRAYFASGHSEPGDIDAGVNANVLTWLGRYAGDERLIAWLLQILRDGRETTCDRYYHNPLVILYFFARALAPHSKEARALLLARSEQFDLSRPVDLALAVLIRSLCRAPVPAAMLAALIAAQAGDGSWPIGALYCAGRPETAPGHFAEPDGNTLWFGSEAISTALAVRALCAVRA